MRLRTATLLCALVLGGCQEKKPTPGVAVLPENLPPEPGPTTAGSAAADTPSTPVAGAVQGKPFKPDVVKLEGNRLSFRVGKDFFADAEIAFDLPSDRGPTLQGKTWAFNGEFEAPPLFVAVRAAKGDLPKTEIVFSKDHTLRLTFTRQTKTNIEGTIDLKVKSLPDTHLAGTFTAEAKKAATDPLDAADAPYVRGAVKLGDLTPEETVVAGFTGKGADGKEYSNSAGMPLFMKGKPTGSHVTSLTFAPQMTTLMGRDKGDPEYRHTHVPPGDYVVYFKLGDVVAAWKRLTVKAGDALTIDLTVDPKTFGEVVVTIPPEEAKATAEWPLELVPADAVPDLRSRSYYAFQAAEVKKDQKTVTVKGVPAGKYRAVRGESEADVEVAAGKSVAVTLVRKGK
jgi:hypothetical protein